MIALFALAQAATAPTTVPVYIVPSATDPNASTWTPAALVSLIAALVAGALAIIAALKSNTATNATTATEARVDRTNKRVDTLLLHTPPPTNESLSSSTRTPGAGTGLLPAVLFPLALGTLALIAAANAGCQATQSAERLQYQTFREGLYKGTAPTLREYAEWSQALAGDTDRDGHITAADGPAPLPTAPGLPNLSSRTPAERESWLAPRLEVPKQFESWYQSSKQHDTTPVLTPTPGGP